MQPLIFLDAMVEDCLQLDSYCSISQDIAETAETSTHNFRQVLLWDDYTRQKIS